MSALAELALPGPGHGRAWASFRARLVDGSHTTVYARPYALEQVRPRVVSLRRPEPLAAWCGRQGVRDALVGGFFIRSSGEPLGELRTGGMLRRSQPFLEPWQRLRSCIHLEAGRIAIAPRPELPQEPRGDLLQAGPLLVRDGRPALGAGEDPEGFSAGASQFDSDITRGRYPRAALGLAGGVLWAVACDGRADAEAGLTLSELADTMVRLGCDAAVNLDGGGSASLVCDGALVNRPRARHGVPIPGGRPVCTALVFEPHEEVRHG